MGAVNQFLRPLAIVAVLGGVAAAQAQVIYATDSLAKRVWSFSAQDGSLVNSNVVSFGAERRTIQQVIPLDNGNWIVSDQGDLNRTGDGVFEYSSNGTLLRTFGDSAGGVQNVRGITMRNGFIYAAVAGGTFGNTIQRWDYSTGTRTTLIDTNVSEPWAVDFVDNDLIVSTQTTHDLERFTESGAYIGKAVDSNGGQNDLNRPYQFAKDTVGGGLWVTGFSRSGNSANPGWGMYRYDAAGNRTGYWGAVVSPRGVFVLGNGSLLLTSGVNVQTFLPTSSSNGTLTTVGNNGNSSSFRFLTSGTPVALVPEPASLAILGLGAVGLLRRRKK